MPTTAATYAYDAPNSHADHLNSPRQVYDENQALRWRWDQAEPFGASPADENPAALGAFEFNLRFPGQYADAESGNFYNYFRDYDPATGRYVQSDPIGLLGGSNTYLYVYGNPTSFTDPEGLAGGQPAIPSILRPPGNPFTDPTQSQRERSDNLRRCLTGQCEDPEVPLVPNLNQAPRCGWDCPKSEFACSPGDPNQSDSLGTGLFPPRAGCVWRCRPGPFLTPGR